MRTWRIPRRAAQATRSASRPIRSRNCGGLLWAYLGPEPAPLVPDWEFFSWKNGFRQIVMAEIPCNWFQCQENSIDPVHFEWTHSNWSVRLAGKPTAPTRRSTSRSISASSITASSTSASAPIPPTRTGCGPSAASACGRTGCSPATMSSSACRSTTRTRSASCGISAACRRSASPMCRTASRPGRGRSPIRRPGAGSPAM